MARVDIPVDVSAPDGENVTAATVANHTDDHEVIGGADGRTLLLIQSTDGSDRDVLIEANPDLFVLDGLTVNPLTITVPANGFVVAGPFRQQSFKQSATNDLFVNPAVSTTLTFRAIRLSTL